MIASVMAALIHNTLKHIPVSLDCNLPGCRRLWIQSYHYSWNDQYE